jgi:hypothetical protein
MKHSFKKLFMFIVISLALIINAFRVIPAYAALGPTVSITSSENRTVQRDSNPPAAPTVNEPPSFTSDTTPTISGTAEEDSRVNVWYLDDLGNPVQICRNVLADDINDEENGTGEWSCVSSQVLPEREIELIVNATDKAGNVSADTSYVFTIGTGTGVPNAPVVTAPVGVTNDTTPTISGTAEAGGLVNVWYLDDLGNPVQICQDVPVDSSGHWSCVSSQVLPEREIELVVNVTDAAGNTSADASFFFKVDTTIVDTTPPTVSSLVRAGENPPSTSTLDYTVTFSEPVTGVDAGDFSFDVTGTMTGPSIENVTGSGDTYTVTVIIGPGSGTLELTIPATATITDLAGNPLGGLPYTSGEVYTIAANHDADTGGVFRPGDIAWFLRNTNTTGVPDISTNFGLPGDYPFAGDWDGNGTDTIGVYRNGVFYLSNSNTAPAADIVFAFGMPGDQPIAGDWDNDGIDTVGLYRGSTITFYLRNSNSTGAPDISFAFGNPGDVGLAGDWNGDGIDTTGVFRPSEGTLYLRNSNSAGFADIAATYGIPGDKPVTGDWNNDGIDTIGVYRNGTFYLRNTNTIGFADLAFSLTTPGDMPVAGNWDALP